MIKHLIFIVTLVLISTYPAQSQQKPEVLTLNGYTSTMQSVMFDSLSGPFINDNLLHNRLNFKVYVNNNITFATEFRNRLFTGDMVRLDPSYSSATASDQGFIDLSWNILNEPSF
ncbi:MAG: hypothetical protein MUO43_08170, partial [Desulfobacterales bacterium]|nr:hypothetical protein [Desulfobacterales bacterium]